MEQIRKWILQGASEHDIREAAAEKWPGFEPRPLIVAAVAAITATSQYDPEAVLGWAVEATRYLYSRMIEIGDFPGALRAVKQLIDLARNPLDLDDPQPETPEDAE